MDLFRFRFQRVLWLLLPSQLIPVPWLPGGAGGASPKALENSSAPCRAVLGGCGRVCGWQRLCRAFVPATAPGAFVNNVHEMVVETLGPRVESGIPRNNLAPAGARLSLSPCLCLAPLAPALGSCFCPHREKKKKTGQGLKPLLHESLGNSGPLGIQDSWIPSAARLSFASLQSSPRKILPCVS